MLNFTSNRPQLHPRAVLFPRVNRKPLYAKIPPGWWYLAAFLFGLVGWQWVVRFVAWMPLAAEKVVGNG